MLPMMVARFLRIVGNANALLATWGRHVKDLFVRTIHAITVALVWNSLAADISAYVLLGSMDITANTVSRVNVFF